MEEKIIELFKIANSINETLIKKMWVEKWNGVMPKTTTGTNTMMMIGNG